MPREFSRTERLGEQIQRELAGVLHTEVGDPRVQRVVVSGVEVSRDLAHARVYVTRTKPVAGEAESPRDDASVLEGLQRASGFLRRRLASRLRIRAVPALHFTLDKTLDQAERIESLLADARRSGPSG